MRPNHIVPTTHDDNERAATPSDDERGPTIEELRQEAGEDDNDDIDYSEVQRGTSSRRGRGRAPVSLSSRAEQAPPRSSALSATTYELNSFIPGPAPRSQLDALRGSQPPPIPTLSTDTPVRNLINPLFIAPPMPQPILAPINYQSRSLSTAPRLAPRAISASVAVPAQTANSPFFHARSIDSPSDTGTAQKRTASDALSEDEDERNERRARKKDASNASRQRYKFYKSDAALYKAMRDAASLLQVRFASQIPFPAQDEREDLAKEVFAEILHDQQLAPTYHVLAVKDLKLLKSEDTGIRSRVRRAAVAHVPRAYLLEKTSDPAKQRSNAALVKGLLSQSSFHYEDPNKRLGRFQHQIIADIIWEVFFSHANALGCLYQESFRPIPHELLALVLTTVRHALTMWETGRKVSKRFSAAHYKIYDQYLSAIEQFSDGELAHFWEQHRQNMFRQGLLHAGCAEQLAPQEHVIDLAADDEIAQELQHLRTRYSSGAGGIGWETPASTASTAPYPLSTPSLSTSQTRHTLTTQAVSGQQIADYNGEFDNDISHVPPGCSHSNSAAWSSEHACPSDKENDSETDPNAFDGRPSRLESRLPPGPSVLTITIPTTSPV